MWRKLDQHDLEQHHRAYAWPTVVLAVQILYKFVYLFASDRCVDLPQQVPLRDHIFQTYKFSIVLYFCAFYQLFYHPIPLHCILFPDTRKKATFRRPFSTGRPAAQTIGRPVFCVRFCRRDDAPSRAEALPFYGGGRVLPYLVCRADGSGAHIFPKKAAESKLSRAAFSHFGLLLFGGGYGKVSTLPGPAAYRH